MTVFDMSLRETIHATAVRLPVYTAPFDAGIGDHGVAVVLRGPSGSGKSDLALRLIARYRATLIADDQVMLRAPAQHVLCEAPAALAGLIEVRGLGLLKLETHTGVPLALVVDLVARDEVPRLPPEESVTLCNIAVPRLKLHAFDDSTLDKIIAALAVVKNPELVIR